MYESVTNVQIRKLIRIFVEIRKFDDDFVNSLITVYTPVFNKVLSYYFLLIIIKR